ncbi:LOB domain-containing protein 12-like [Primulina huaijiensis]|uniref:LOB domain-containing protein 12-like n=1 Tax=Primulina huaijiensis TaxID=1492673 RepID=UPI003CC726AD
MRFKMGGGPCASCKLLRRRCSKDCIFAPYFPPDDPHKFAMVHKVFGASNVSKMLHDVPVHQRADAVSSLVYEANARIRDPVYGCVGAISYLQNEVSRLQTQLAVAEAEILMCIDQMQHQVQPETAPQPQSPQSDHDKSLLLASSHDVSLCDFQNCHSFAATSVSYHVMQDPLKRESVWY